MNTAITRIGFLLIPAALALALAPAAAMADELQNGAAQLIPATWSIRKNPLPGKRQQEMSPLQKTNLQRKRQRQSLQARRQTQALLSLQRQQKMDSCWKTDI